MKPRCTFAADVASPATATAPAAPSMVAERADDYRCSGCGATVRLYAREPLPPGWRTVAKRVRGRKPDAATVAPIRSWEYLCPACAHEEVA